MHAAPFRRLVSTLAVAVLLAVIVPLGAAAVSFDPDDDPGSPVNRSNAALTYQLFEDVFNGDDADAAAALVSEDAVIETSFGEYQGSEGLLEYIAFVKRTYPDAVFDVTSVSVQGGTIEVRWVMTATRFILDPVERPVEMQVERPGTATLTIAESQVAGLSLVDGELILIAPETEVAVVDVPLGSQPH